MIVRCVWKWVIPQNGNTNRQNAQHGMLEHPIIIKNGDFTKGLTTLTAVNKWIKRGLLKHIISYKMTPNIRNMLINEWFSWLSGLDTRGLLSRSKHIFLNSGWHVVDVDDTLKKYRGNDDDDDDDDILSDISCGVLRRIHAGVSPADRWIWNLTDDLRKLRPRYVLLYICIYIYIYTYIYIYIDKYFI